MPKSCVYGPVNSWRLGRSLGIDMLCTEQKTCNFDCVYCQLGSVAKLQTERQEFISLERLNNDLNTAKGVTADWVIFSGMGEPTLAANLGEAITMAKTTLGLPVAVLTNASLIHREDVRRELAFADMVVAKLDAHEETLFHAINRPAEGISQAKILQSLQMFRMEYNGTIAVDIMLSDLNKEHAYYLQYAAKCIVPDQVQLNTPLRPCAIKPLPATDIETFRKNWFWSHKNVKTAYDTKRLDVVPLDIEETELRHPTKPKSSPVNACSATTCQSVEV